MYDDDLKRKTKIGVVTIDTIKNLIRIRFTYSKGKRNSFYAGRFTDANWQAAIKTAQIIDRDIYIGDYDSTLVRYKPELAKALEITSKEPNLVELWESYKKISQNRVAATTIKKHWRDYEKHYLGKTPKELLELNKAEKFITHLLSRYSPGSILPIFSNCLHPSVNLAVKTGKIKRNIYADIPLRKSPKKQVEAYEPNEVKLIVSSFYNDKYVKKTSSYPHSFYAAMIDFMSLVGCRPSECHALTWNDIKRKDGRLYIQFNKAYSNGILLPHTKNYESRLFPVNDQLKMLIETMPMVENDNNLIFPSVKGCYVNQKTFNRRYWRVIIDGLCSDGKLDRGLRCYSLRHSFITRCVRNGIDIATIARISGNSTDTIIKYYLAAKNSYEVPFL